MEMGWRTIKREREVVGGSSVDGDDGVGNGDG